MELDKSNYKLVLIGNPNSGKTTLFNQLTGSNQYVGNWPGVTVEKKEGLLKNSHISVKIVDLPGIYSLSPYSPEEVLTRNYIIEENPDLIINILDSTNLERNLYLTTQLLELNIKTVLALNMTDILEKKGRILNFKILSKKLGIPVIQISASKNKNINDLIKVIFLNLNKKNTENEDMKIFSLEIKNILDKISDLLEVNKFEATKIFEDDFMTIKKLNLSERKKNNLNLIKNSIVLPEFMDREILIADQRYKFICNLCKSCIWNFNSKKFNISFSDKIDKILTGKYTAIPIFIVFILIIFYVTFGPAGNYLKNLFEVVINDNVGYYVKYLLNYFHASVWTKSLILDAVIKGVGSVISFLPQVLLLYTLLSFLEDTGYMARAAYIMDKLLKKIGLSGKAFIPLLMGFGCSVPAVLGTRILENKKDRQMTIFLIPFMSCSAKIPVYLLFASSIFKNYQTFLIFSLYIFGVILAIFTAYLFKDTLFYGENPTFIMEIPSYKLPSFKNLWIHIWERTKDFVERAGTVILVATILIWFLQSFNIKFNYISDSSKSIISVIGNFISPVFTICGFNDWRAVVSLLTGLIAKESIVSTMSVLYNTDNIQDLSNMLTNSFSIYSALSYLIFILLYTPCVAAVSAIQKEFKNTKLTLISIVYQIFIAFLFSSLVFQFGILFSKIFK
ncbi:MAG: ferrous iron transport protein B [Candidatus Paraimprobicoccus trichonymphae]|uniref:Ferrous iron transport protein B n=1 Tax=Candidatus Paraimprobicoccus trichonymphae TaxID=3033793 RepID=A0AA48HX68_9FIRM|nr:MAG: ferrous iron transport protein B [Candidatus Paraimprobicoccus trichonymphae]